MADRITHDKCDAEIDEFFIGFDIMPEEQMEEILHKIEKWLNASFVIHTEPYFRYYNWDDGIQSCQLVFCPEALYTHDQLTVLYIKD